MKLIDFNATVSFTFCGVSIHQLEADIGWHLTDDSKEFL